MAKQLCADCGHLQRRERSVKLQDDDTGPSLARGLFRIGVFVGCAAFVLFFFWETYSSSAALSRLSAAASNFAYTESCDANGNPTSVGEPNCVDLGRYVFVHGPVLKAFRRACSGSGDVPGVVVLEIGKAPRIEIHRVEKAFRFRSRNGVNVPCLPAIGRMVRSTLLLSISMRPSVRKSFKPSQYLEM